jgi:ER lumen protein retaining receptor
VSGCEGDRAVEDVGVIANMTPWADLFWTFTDSLYNTTFKILFIGSSAYIIHLMLNDYKPTHDPNIDTFKVQYLLGFSALFGLVFAHDYSLSEVGAWPRRDSETGS